jgi:hypothetical protein
MTFDELKGLVLEAARENRDAIGEEDGIAESTAEFFAWFDLLAAVDAVRIINRGDDLMSYIWTIDPDPRREADERLWREMDRYNAGISGLPREPGDYTVLKRLIHQHREAIQAINAGKPPA